jgi:predicted lipid-binding transport protein (Tim44 family)
MNDDTTALLAQNLLWSAGGLVVGMLLAALLFRVAGTTRAERLRQLVGMIIVILLIGSQITYYRTTAQARDQTECYRPFYVGVSEALASRTPDTNATSDAQIELLRATAGGDPQATREAIEVYIATLQRQKANRAQQPIPQPPDCG